MLSRPAVPAVPGGRLRPVSTGPRTIEGKARSSRNSIKHGLTAKQIVVSEENQPEFDRLASSMDDEYKPKSEIECQLVAEIVSCLWRLARARHQEEQLIERERDLFRRDGQHLGFDRLLRYMGAIERQLNRSIVRLQHVQTERRKLETAPEPLKVMAAGEPNSFFDNNIEPARQFVLSTPDIGVSAAPLTPQQSGSRGILHDKLDRHAT